jgi:hypothetical protein
LTLRVLCGVALVAGCVAFQPHVSGEADLAWATSWTGSVQGPYPIGNASAQPDLSMVFPSADPGARDQSFRLIVRPDGLGNRDANPAVERLRDASCDVRRRVHRRANERRCRPRGDQPRHHVRSPVSGDDCAWQRGLERSRGAAVRTAMTEIAARLHAKNVRVFGATLTSALGSAGGSGSAETDVKRRTLNDRADGCQVRRFDRSLSGSRARRWRALVSGIWRTA